MTQREPQNAPEDPSSENLSRYLPSSTAPLSEDANAGMGAPAMDLIAAAFIATVAAWFTVESLRLPVPGKLITAPGLLPIVVSVSLLIMALLLGFGAWSRYRGGDGALVLPPGIGRTAILGLIVAAYVAGIQFIPVRQAFTLAGTRFVLGSFEFVSVVALSAILRTYWRQPLWICLLTSIGWIAILSVTFRNVFHIQLP